jgi:hypothetical protein
VQYAAGAEAVGRCSRTNADVALASVLHRKALLSRAPASRGGLQTPAERGYVRLMWGTWERRMALTRRAFLRSTAGSAGLVTLSQLRFPAAVAAAPGPLRVLTPYQAEILTAIVERMVFTGDPSMPAVRDTRAIETIDRAVQQLDPSVQSQLGWLLIVFQWAPPVLQLKLKTFTALTPAEQDAYISDWATSASLTRKLVFTALKNLSVLGYYAQDATWKGIHYSGPWIPRPPRGISDAT